MPRFLTPARIAVSTPAVVLAVVLGAALAPASAVAASLFTTSVVGTGVGATTDQDPADSAVNGGFTDTYSTGAWTGSAVANAYSGAGAELALGAGNTGSFAFVCGQGACLSAQANASTSDMVRINPTLLAPVGTAINVRFDLTLDGTVVGNGGWSVSASGDLLTNQPGVSYNNGTGGTVGAYDLAIHEVMSFTRTMLVGTDYQLGTGLDVRALLRGFGPSPFGIDVNFRDTLRIQAFMLNNDVGPLEMLGDSGRDYFLTPVPLPAATWFFGSALALMGVMRRKLVS